MTPTPDPVGFGGTTVENDVEIAALLGLQISALRILPIPPGKGAETFSSDQELAMRLYKEVLKKTASFFSDRALARSISDNSEFHEKAIEQRVLRKQRYMRHGLEQLNLSGIIIPRNPTDAKSQVQVLHDRLMGHPNPYSVREFASKISDTTDNKVLNAESSAGESSRSTNRRQCIACLSDARVSQIVKLPCGQKYCTECLGSLFEKSMSDPTLFPPRCCHQPFLSVPSAPSPQTKMCKNLKRKRQSSRHRIKHTVQ